MLTIGIFPNEAKDTVIVFLCVSLSHSVKQINLLSAHL